MTKRLSILTMAVSMLLMVTGCLKDKGFDNQQYGIQISEVKGVLFPQAGGNAVAIGITSSASPLTIQGPLVTLEEGGPAANDVKVAITVNNPTDVTLVPLPAGSFTFAPSTVTIPKGSTLSDALKITFPNSSTLDPNKKYGLGFTIASVDQGYRIAGNLKKVDFSFSVKNKYDGIYQLTGFHNRPTLDLPYNEEVHMITSGPNSVYMFWPAANKIAHPINGGATYYGSFTTNFIFDATDKLVAWDLTPYALGTLIPSVGPATTSRWDPATKTIYAQFYYNNNPGARLFTDTLKYKGPRP